MNTYNYIMLLASITAFFIGFYIEEIQTQSQKLKKILFGIIKSSTPEKESNS